MGVTMSHSLHFETLEARRVMTAGLSATLTGGVLSIVGTTDADTIALEYDKTQVTVVELAQSFTLKQVKEIHIATDGGDDSVQFISVGNKPNKWIGKVVTVSSDGGNDEFVGPGEAPLYFGGDAILTTKKSGKIKIDGDKPTWFDQAIADPDLRELAKQRIVDKVFSRGDMLELFDQVSEASTLSAGQFSGLQAIVNNASLFKKQLDVQTLSGYVVNGSVANAEFQGAALGNLAVGSSGEHLATLVDKWFLGKDHPAAENYINHNALEYHEAAGTLFVDGISYTDISQGVVGNSAPLAGVAAIAVHSSKPIAKMITVNGDGTYTFRFYRGADPYFVTVDSQLPTDTFGTLMFALAGRQVDDATNELWVPFFEKAYAQLAEFGWLESYGTVQDVNAYAAIYAVYPGQVLAQVTGKSVEQSLDLEDVAGVAKAFKKHAITLTSDEDPAAPYVLGGRTYALVEYNAKTQQFVLFNPWGIDNDLADGMVWLTGEQLQQNFSAWISGRNCRV